MRSRIAVIVAAALGVAGVVVYVRRRRASALPSVQLGLEDGGTLSLSAGDQGVAELQTAAAAVRRGFRIGS